MALKDLFMSKAKKEQLAREAREQEYRRELDQWDRTRWASVSDAQLTRLISELDKVYQRARTNYSAMKPPYGVSKFHFENLSSPEDILYAWKKDSYSAKKGFGTNYPALERRMYAELRLSYEFYRKNMPDQAKAELYDTIKIIDEFLDRFCSMEVEDAAEAFAMKYY